MQVIATVLSNEVQRISARDTARMTALKDASFQKEFAAGTKNLNTALREAEDEINPYLASQTKK